MILGDMSVAVRGRPPKGVARRNVVLRIPKDLLERIKAHQARLEALAGVSIARHDVMLVLLQKGLEASPFNIDIARRAAKPSTHDRHACIRLLSAVSL